MLTPQIGSATKLFEALEKLGQSAGAGLRSDGPLGRPSDDLVRAFQEAMNSPGQGAAESFPGGSGEGASVPSGAAAIPGVEGTGPPKGVSDTAGALPADVPDPSPTPPPAPPADPGPAERMPPVERSGEASRDFVHAEDSSATASVPSPGVLGEGPPGTAESPAQAAPAGADGADGVRESRGAENREPDAWEEIGRLLEKFAQPGASLSPADVYRLQYVTGMLKMQMQSGQKLSQQTTQGLESVLRQQ